MALFGNFTIRQPLIPTWPGRLSPDFGLWTHQRPSRSDHPPCRPGAPTGRSPSRLKPRALCLFKNVKEQSSAVLSGRQLNHSGATFLPVSPETGCIFTLLTASCQTSFQVFCPPPPKPALISFPGSLHAEALPESLQYPHHGGKGGADHKVFIEKLCAAFSPTMVVFSVARGRPKHPLPSVIQLLRQQLKSVRIVCTQLTVHCASRIPANDPNHLANVFSQGRETRSCCGGTIVIALDGAGSLSPQDTQHFAFIKSEAPTALCR